MGAHQHHVRQSIMPNNQLTKLILKNFLATARGAVEARMFQHLYVRDQTGAERDVMQGGELSCAYVVSGILTLYGLIDRPHATVATTLQKMAEAGWQQTETARRGAIVHWPEHDGHEHLGIMIGDNLCVSNSDTTHMPMLHGLTLSSGVRPRAFYIHAELAPQ